MIEEEDKMVMSNLDIFFFFDEAIYLFGRSGRLTVGMGLKLRQRITAPDRRTEFTHIDIMHPSSQFHKELAQIVRADDDNRRCCDCGKRNPRWASTNLGCFMCLECSGIHRAIGVHITKIKSITLDKWTRSEVDHMKKVGNRIHNARWEAFLDNGRYPTAVQHEERDVFIRAKYNGRKYFSDIPKDQLPPPVEMNGDSNGGEAGKPKFQTAAQRAKMRREKAAREKAQKEAADREAALKAKQEQEESARQTRENEDKMASRKKQMEARISQKQKEKEAARLRRQQRKNQRVRRRSKELSSLYPSGNSKASASSVDKSDVLVGEVVSDPSTGTKENNDNDDNLIDLMSGDNISHSPVTTPAVSDMGGDGGGVSGFSFMSNVNNDEGQQPQAPQVDAMVSGFSFCQQPQAITIRRRMHKTPRQWQCLQVTLLPLTRPSPTLPHWHRRRNKRCKTTRMQATLAALQSKGKAS